MENVLEQLDRFPGDNHALTIRLLEKMDTFYKIPRLRQKLVKISSGDSEPHIPQSGWKDLAYLVSGLLALAEVNTNRLPQSCLVPELDKYLRTCESYGISIGNFLIGTVKPWDEIRPKYQELSQLHLIDALQRCFSKVKAQQSISMATYLLHQDLARLVPVFPFHRASSPPAVWAIRAQPDLPWTLVTKPYDAISTLYVHFPEIAWKSGGVTSSNICFVGVRVLSPLSQELSLLLQKSIAGLSHLSTTRVRDKQKLLSLVFFSEADANLFKFNVTHYSKFSSIHQQFVSIGLSDYRRGYPGLSGFFDHEIIQELGLEPWCVGFAE